MLTLGGMLLLVPHLNMLLNRAIPKSSAVIIFTQNTCNIFYYRNI
jgi:hypothetical protein